MNIVYTQYDIIHEVATETKMRVTQEEDEEWDVWFIDGPVMPSLLTKLKTHQRTNHFPGM